jgi:hypothetical protein
LSKPKIEYQRKIVEPDWDRAKDPDVPVLERIRVTAQMQRYLEQFQLRLMAEARRDEAPWADIADAMGVSKQAVISRWRPLIERVFPSLKGVVGRKH